MAENSGAPPPHGSRRSRPAVSHHSRQTHDQKSSPSAVQRGCSWPLRLLVLLPPPPLPSPLLHPLPLNMPVRLPVRLPVPALHRPLHMPIPSPLRLPVLALHRPLHLPIPLPPPPPPVGG